MFKFGFGFGYEIVNALILFHDIIMDDFNFENSTLQNFIFVSNL